MVSMRLIGDRRILLGSVCVETVAAVLVFLSGHLSLVAVAVLYWIDLLAVTLRTMVQQLLSRPETDRQSTVFQRPFRLLAHKRGSVTVTDRLPGIYPRNLSMIWGAVAVLALSVSTTVYVAAVNIPGELWRSPATPLLIGVGLVAAATKSWLGLRAYVASGGYEVTPASAVVPRKRMLIFAVYGGVLWLASRWTLATLSGEGTEIARAGMMVSASVLIVSRLAYGWHAARTRPDSWRSDSVSDRTDGRPSQERLIPDEKENTPVPSQASIPDGEPRETMTPGRASIIAAGVVNAMTTGGVVDKRFGHWRQFTIRVGIAGAIIFAVFALLNGAIVVSAGVAVISIGLIGGLSMVGAVHMLLALGGVEYEFYESTMVAYDRYLGRPQWSASYDDVRNISVEGGLFGSPLWLNTGTVFFDRISNLNNDEAAQEQRSSIAFVPNPEHAGELLSSRQ
jgi:hypothetical protein